MRALVVAIAAVSVLFAAEQRTAVYVTPAAASLVEQGLAEPAPTGPEAAAFEDVSAPVVRARPGQAQATEAPWVDSNGWRFHRGVTKARYSKLPAGSAALAAAEAWAYNVDAILDPDPADVEDLAQMLRFLKQQNQVRLPILANVGVVDDGSPAMGEALNLLVRRNLLFKLVPPSDRSLPVVQLGTPEFAKDAARDPSDFAARVRAKIGDDNRLLRIYGSSTVIARLTADPARTRLCLLAYATNQRRRQGRAQQDVRIRLVGRMEPIAVAAFGAPPDARPADVEHIENTTEFLVPPFSTIAIVDLRRAK